MTTSDAPKIRFDIFYKHDDLTRLLFEYAQTFPTLAAIRSIGKSYEGRDIWVATLTNLATACWRPTPSCARWWCRKGRSSPPTQRNPPRAS